MCVRGKSPLFYFKQKTAYEGRISDWSSDVCSSDLELLQLLVGGIEHLAEIERGGQRLGDLVELVQEGVGVGQAAQAIHRDPLALVGPTRDSAGVAGHPRDGHDPRGPLPPTPRAVSADDTVAHTRAGRGQHPR